MCQLCTPRPTSREDRTSNDAEGARDAERDAARYDGRY